MTDEEKFVRRAIALLDLTDLSDTLDEAGVQALCQKAWTPFGTVAAVCTWPQFVGSAKKAMKAWPVKVATVVNFPEGATDSARTINEARRVVYQGADELDLVLPYRAFGEGRMDDARTMIRSVRTIAAERRVLKVILETGELKTPELIRKAADFALVLGADFIKTSTGKTPVSATLEATGIILDAIKASGRQAGLKPSGGIRTVADAKAYIDQADARMGVWWTTAKRFRLGASGLLDALIAHGKGGAAAPAKGY